jgi:hypothetical protein
MLPHRKIQKYLLDIDSIEPSVLWRILIKDISVLKAEINELKS